MADLNLMGTEPFSPDPAVSSGTKVLLGSFSLPKLDVAPCFAMGETLGHLPAPSTAAVASSWGCKQRSAAGGSCRGHHL